MDDGTMDGGPEYLELLRLDNGIDIAGRFSRDP
jgi:hypothetical protein